jgi:hypothetical protein
LILFSPDKHTVNLQTGNGTPKTIKKYGFKDLNSGFLRKLKKIDEVRRKCWQKLNKICVEIRKNRCQKPSRDFQLLID